MRARPYLSIVVPVLNEAALLEAFVWRLRSVAPEAEIIVVDGKSSDDTQAIAESIADVVLSSPRGRASQMNAGAAVARGEVLWFLHADLEIPDGTAEMIAAAMSDPRQVGGCFRLRFPPRPHIYRISDSLGNFAVDLFGIALGDHGIFCRRATFQQIRGYPSVPILEDAELYRRLKRCGRMTQLPAEVRCSPRAYEAYGPHRITAAYFIILVLYFLCVPISVLHLIYLRARRSASPRPPHRRFVRQQHERRFLALPH